MALGDILAEITNDSSYIDAIDFFDNNKKAVLNKGNEAVVWDLENNLIMTEVTHTDAVRDVKVSYDEMTAVSCDFDNIIVWDIETGNVINTYSDVNNNIKKVIISKDDTRIIFIAGSNLYVWEISTGTILVEYTEHSIGVGDLTISPDGSSIASGGTDYNIKMWDIETGNTLQSINYAHTRAINTVDYHPDGDKLVSGGGDDLIKIWDLETGDLLHELAQHTRTINSCKFFPDGKRVLSGSDDKQILIWNIEDNEVQYNKDNYGYSIELVNVTEDGSKIVVVYRLTAELIELINADGLVFRNKYGQVYNTDPNYLSNPIELGRVLITEDSDIYELQFLNNKNVAVKNVVISASNEKVGTDLTFSKTAETFEELQSVTFSGPYDPDGYDTFYIKLNTDLEAEKGENSIYLNASAEFAY